MGEITVGRSLGTGVAAPVVVLIFWAFCQLLSPTGTAVRLTADTVLAMGGASNPHGFNMNRELSGYASGAVGTPYAGYDFEVVPWSAEVFDYVIGGMPYDSSQMEGVAALERAIRGVDSGSKVVVVGYSASAGVVTKQLRVLQDRREQGLSAPSPDDLSFVVMGNPNRPNGGILSRLAGLYVPRPVGATFDGPTPTTDYQLLDVSWQYDPISDLPLHPFNALADVNALVAFLTRHSFYYDADPTDPASVLSDVTVGNTRYLTLKREHLPVLEPLYAIGILNPILDAVEPALRYVIDLAYDRTVSPGVPMPLRATPMRRDPAAVVQGFFASLTGVDVPTPASLPVRPELLRHRSQHANPGAGPASRKVLPIRSLTSDGKGTERLAGHRRAQPGQSATKASTSANAA
jgi:hypothetical protein